MKKRYHFDNPSFWQQNQQKEDKFSVLIKIYGTRPLFDGFLTQADIIFPLCSCSCYYILTMTTTCHRERYPNSVTVD